MNRREHISEYVSRIVENGSLMWLLLIGALLAGVTVVGWLILGAES